MFVLLDWNHDGPMFLGVASTFESARTMAEDFNRDEPGRAEIFPVDADVAWIGASDTDAACRQAVKL